MSDNKTIIAEVQEDITKKIRDDTAYLDIVDVDGVVHASTPFAFECSSQGALRFTNTNAFEFFADDTLIFKSANGTVIFTCVGRDIAPGLRNRPLAINYPEGMWNLTLDDN